MTNYQKIVNKIVKYEMPLHNDRNERQATHRYCLMCVRARHKTYESAKEYYDYYWKLN